jgi:anaerobic selenocysteine-containing dehydrogenase
MEARHAGALEMHPADAAARGLATGDAVEVFNARGSIQLHAQIGDSVPQGVVAARMDWNKLSGDGSERSAIPTSQKRDVGHPLARNVNALTSEALTDIGAGATFYSTLVEVRRA